MSEFKVIKIIDGDTFDVTPQWKWNGKSGSRVRPTGYNAPEINTFACWSRSKKEAIETYIW